MLRKKLNYILFFLIFSFSCFSNSENKYEAQQWFIKGKYLFNVKKQYEQSYYALKKSLELYPDHKEAQIYYKKVIGVIKLLNITLKLEVEKANKLKLKEEAEKERLLAEKNRKEREEERLKELKRKEKQIPGLEEFHFLAGENLFQKGKLKKAEHEFKESLKLYPENIKCLLYLFKIYDNFNNTKKILEITNKLEEFYRPFYLLKKMKKEKGLKYATEKLVKLEKYYKYLPDEKIIDDIHEYIICWIKRKFLETVIEKYNTEINLANIFNEKNDLPFLEETISIEPMTKKIDQNKLISEKFIEKELNCPIDGKYTINNNRVICSKHSLVKRSIENIIAIKNLKYNPQQLHDAEILNKKGNKYLKRNLFKKAFIQYEKAIKIAKDYSQTYNNIGKLYYAKKEYKKALENFNIAIEKKFNFLEAINNKALTYIKLEDLTKAEIEFKKALAIQLSNPSIHYNLALLYIKKKENKKAIEHLKKAIIINPDEPAYHFYLGNIYEKEGEKNRAVSEYNYIKKIVPEYGQMYNMIVEKIKALGGR